MTSAVYVRADHYAWSRVGSPRISRADIAYFTAALPVARPEATVRSEVCGVITNVRTARSQGHHELATASLRLTRWVVLTSLSPCVMSLPESLAKAQTSKVQTPHIEVKKPVTHNGACIAFLSLRWFRLPPVPYTGATASKRVLQPFTHDEALVKQSRFHAEGNMIH